MDLAERIFKRSGYVMLDKFGMRFHPTLKVWKMHNGVDKATVGKTKEEKKWKQYALEEGFVVSAGTDSTKAIFAWIEYPSREERILHYHLDKLYVKKGQKVNENTIIGLTGETGNTTGIHLHLGVKKKINGKWVYVDPETINYIPQTIKVNGILDVPTIKELQKRCGTIVDGIISEPSQLISEIQRRLISGEPI